MEFLELKSCKYALTHSATFHADDVFSAAFLKIINPDIQIIRKNEVPSDFDGLVFDIGLGEFDHHQVDNELRKNSIPYASFGKLWRKYASNLYEEELVKSIDEKFIQAMDLSDNTGNDNTLAYAISVFNPTWESNSNGDKEFEEALNIAIIILNSIINSELSIIKSNKILMDIYNQSDDKKIIILDKHYPYRDIYVDTDAIFVIYPSKRGGFVAQGVPIKKNDITLKKDFPSRWLENKPDYINFIHKSLFLINTNSIDDAIKACNIALEE